VVSDASAPGGARLDAGMRPDASGAPGSPESPDAGLPDGTPEDGDAEGSDGSGGCATRTPQTHTSTPAVFGLLLWTLRRLRRLPRAHARHAKDGRRPLSG
jgi:hypothetical protein